MKTLDELRAAHPELLKELDDKIAELTARIGTLEKDIADRMTEIESLRADVGTYVEGVRAIIEAMCDLPGVMPEDAEEKAEVKPDDEVTASR